MELIQVFWIILSLPYVIWGILSLKYQLHMLQQNSYRNERYSLWLKTKGRQNKKLFLPVLAVIPLLFGVAVGDYVSLLLWVIIYLIFLQTRDRAPAKKPLVFTARAKRLFTVALFVYFLPGLLLVIFVLGGDTNGLQKAVAMAVLILMNYFSWFFLILANIILQPFEEHKKAAYFLEAQKLLSEAPGLIKIAITGSYGKTSVKHILNKIMEEKFYTLMPPGSYNTPMGITITVREQLNPLYQAFITEMGAKQKGDIKELCQLVQPKYGILTAIGEQHLETFGSFENIVDTKFELIEALPEDGIAVLNFDDESIKANAYRMKGKVISYGLYSDAVDYRARDITYNNRGMEFIVEAPNGEWEVIKTKLLGEHNVYNIVGAIAMAQAM
ncbi:MAG: Mur ligase family protein [Bacillota bacterium]|nr:Mur ligase family protein [Bacillota bacterium]